MSTKAQTVAQVENTIGPNGNNAITGQILQNDLVQMIGVSMSWQGAWSSSVQYSSGELVSYSNQFWVGNSPVTGVAPGSVSGQWTLLSSSSFASPIVTDFLADTDFTPGTTQSLTLPISPSASSNLQVFFDGLNQNADTWGLADDVVTFEVVIPIGTQVIEVRIW